jgi:beta-lactamase class A
VKFPLVLSGCLSVLLFASAAEAAKLETWRFDSQQNQLSFTTDETVQPTAQLINNPTRVVIDLPGTRFGRPKVEQAIGNTIRSVRVGQFNPQTTRLVIELTPGYTLDLNQIKIQGQSANRWAVQLPTPQMGTGSDFGSPQPIAIVPPPADDLGGLIRPGQPLAWLQQRFVSLKTKYPSLQSTGVYLLDMDTGNYLDLNGDKVFPTASVIKLPILIAFFQDVDAGKIKLNETLTMSRDVVVGGSGEMQDLPIGSKFSALETAMKMITISDNTATNMIIKRMGGIAVLNQRFRSWGLQKTVIRNWLPDLKGTNTTTAKEMTRLMVLLDQKKLLLPNSQIQAMSILRQVRNRTLLPAGLGRGATIAHKTGDIGFLLGDAGIVEMPSGKRYLVTALVTSPYNDLAARDFIQDISRTAYSYLSQLNQASLMPSRPESVL